MLLAGSYTVPMFARYIKQAGTIVECGCADGQDTVDLITRYRPGHVYAFEPDPTIIERTKASLQVHIAQGTVQLENAAVGAYDGSTEFWLRPQVGSTAGQSSRFPWVRDKEVALTRVDVPQVRLDTYLATNGIGRVDLLCMDLQGGEEQALIGLGARLKTVQWVIAEVFLVPGYYTAGRTVEKVIAILQSAGFNYVACDNFSDFANILYRNPGLV